jgi:glycosyltransferase involved in cell wall biosynthesis
VRFHGAVDRSGIGEVLAQHDALIFPTEEEVLGYVVGEALLAGCPVLVSDRTPWLDLDEWGAGRVLPLDDLDAWVGAIEDIGRSSVEERTERRSNARRRGRHWTRAESDLDAWRALLELGERPA